MGEKVEKDFPHLCDKGGCATRVCVCVRVRACQCVSVSVCVGVLSWGFLWKCTVLSLVEFQQGRL